MRTLPSAAAVTVDAEVLTVAAVAVAEVADEVEDTAFFLGIGEEATRARRESERMVDEKRMFAVCLDLKG